MHNYNGSPCYEAYAEWWPDNEKEINSCEDNLFVTINECEVDLYYALPGGKISVLYIKVPRASLIVLHRDEEGYIDHYSIGTYSSPWNEKCDICNDTLWNCAYGHKRINRL